MLSGKRILITGANGGIGYAISDLLLTNNAKVVLCYHENEQNIKQIINNHSTKVNDIEHYKVDLMNEGSIEQTLKAIIQNGQIDIFIHLPTLQTQHKSIMDLKWTDYQKHIELQSKSFFQITKFLIPYMQKQKIGKIISILTSYVVDRPPGGLSDYVVGKYSLLGLAKCMAVELGKFGIRVNTVSPSIVNTPLTEKLPTKLKEIVSSQVPLENRFAEPIEIAGVVLFLCSDYSNYITGENILVTGGQTMH